MIYLSFRGSIVGWGAGLGQLYIELDGMGRKWVGMGWNSSYIIDDSFLSIFFLFFSHTHIYLYTFSSSFRQKRKKH
jgi:hypothetical protein